jgi:ABC-type bacteriocin/lantibiotic exporter with double-glycine peptidase domain
VPPPSPLFPRSVSDPALNLRLETVTSTDADGNRCNPLSAYLHLIEGKWRLIPMVWFLQCGAQCAGADLPPADGADLLPASRQEPSRVTSELWWVLSSTFGLCVLNVIATVGQQRLRSIQRRSLTAALRRSLVRRLHQLTFVFHDRSQAGVLQNKFILDLNRLEDVHNYLAENIIMQGTTIVVALAIVAWINPWFLLILGPIVPANLIAAHLLWHPMRKRSEEFRQAESGFLSYLQEVLHGLRLTRAHAVEDFAEDRLAEAAHKVASSGIRVDVTNAFFGSIGWSVGSVLNMLVIGVGAWLCVRDTIRADQLFVFYTFYGIIQGGISGIVFGMPAIASASDAINSLAELYAQESEEKNNGKLQLDTIQGAVSLRGVTFKYPNSERHSLSGVDLDIPLGGSLALVGASGSGKSTIASLILGFYEPEKGTIRIDGHDLHEVDRRTYRKHVGVVSQEVVLFQDTVLGNIAWGDPHPDEQRAREAARRANADHFISALPKGYLTMLGDRGHGIVRRPAPAPGDRARALPRPQAADPRRGDQRPRPRERAPGPARTRRADEGEIDADHRPPPLDGPQCRPHRRARGWAHHRAWRLCRADG